MKTAFFPLLLLAGLGLWLWGRKETWLSDLAASLTRSTAEAQARSSFEEGKLQEWRGLPWSWMEFYENGIGPGMAWFALNPISGKMYKVTEQGEFPAMDATPETWL